MAKLELTSLAVELQALESETFEIQDYTEIGDELALVAAGSTSCSCSSTCSTCSTTSSCA